MLPWFTNNAFPLYLAPMAGVTDVVFRELCKELGADVMVTEFISAEGIVRRDDRTRKYTQFSDQQRPVGVQLFGANPDSLAEAARKVIDWKEPEFLDINFGCPVNKVVSKNGGSSLLRDCPTLTRVAESIVNAVSIPVTAKIRIGWDSESINAVHVCQLLENTGIQAIAIHGRTRAQGYSGEANWDVIAECANAVNIPVIGNGDLRSGEDVAHRRATTPVSGAMIGRAAMQNPWIFTEVKHFLKHGKLPIPTPVNERWNFIRKHANMAVSRGHMGDEQHTLMAMRSRLMAYSKGLPNGKHLRGRFSHVSSLMELDDIADHYLTTLENDQPANLSSQCL